MSSIRQASPLDLTGLFCELYDTLPEEPFLSGEVRTALADADRRARVIARAILDESFSVAKTARRLSLIHI